MKYIQTIFTLQLKIFLFLIVYLSSACSAINSPSLAKNTIAENTMQSTNQQITGQNPANSSNKENISLETSQNKDDEFKSPQQIKPRRKKIDFPDDCNFYTVNEKFKLERACAFAINNVLSHLPKESCAYNSFLERGNISNGSSFLYLIEYATDFNSDAIKFYPLSSNKYLVELSCWTATYNLSNVYLLYDESKLPAKAQVLEFSSFEFEYPDDDDSDAPKSVKKIVVKTVGGRYFNPKTKELIVFVKARGIGDAGEYARYSFPKGKPKLEEFRAKFKWEGHGYQMDEVMKHPPKTWKRYYPK